MRAMKAAIYARVSTADQHCELQLSELREYCDRRRWEIAGEYIDAGWSGAKASRPELDKLMKDAKAHRFDVVLVWKLDRFSRSLLHLTEQLNALESAGVRFIATTQGIDTDQANPTSRLLRNMLAAIAEFERDLIRERVSAGVKSYAELYRQGRIGRDRCSRSGKNLAPHRPAAVFDKKRATELYNAGTSVRAIAHQVGASRSVVHRFLASLKRAADPQ